MTDLKEGSKKDEVCGYKAKGAGFVLEQGEGYNLCAKVGGFILQSKLC